MTLEGAEIEDNALCGGGDFNQGVEYTNPLITSAASNQIAAIIWAGDPRNGPGQPYHYGTCTAGGVSFVQLNPPKTFLGGYHC